MKYAVVKLGGGQFIVSEGDEIEVPKLPNKEKDKITISEVLLLVDDKKITVGQPLVKNIEVLARILNHFNGEKIKIGKFKAKTGYRRISGFRPKITRLKIEKIS